MEAVALKAKSDRNAVQSIAHVSLLASATMLCAATANAQQLDRPSVAEVFAVQQEITASEYQDLRGGYYFAAGAAINFGVEFITEINGQAITPIVNGDPALTTGVMTLVDNGQAFVTATNDFTGVLSVVQNSLNSQIIQNATVLQIDLFNVQAALQNGTFASEINFVATLGQ